MYSQRLSNPNQRLAKTLANAYHRKRTRLVPVPAVTGIIIKEHPSHRYGLPQWKHTNCYKNKVQQHKRRHHPVNLCHQLPFQPCLLCFAPTCMRPVPHEICFPSPVISRPSSRSGTLGLTTRGNRGSVCRAMKSGKREMRDWNSGLSKSADVHMRMWGSPSRQSSSASRGSLSVGRLRVKLCGRLLWVACSDGSRRVLDLMAGEQEVDECDSGGVSRKGSEGDRGRVAGGSGGAGVKTCSCSSSEGGGEPGRRCSSNANT